MQSVEVERAIAIASKWIPRMHDLRVVRYTDFEVAGPAISVLVEVCPFSLPVCLVVVVVVVDCKGAMMSYSTPYCSSARRVVV